MRAFVQANPFMAQLLRNPEAVAPEPSAAAVAPQPRPTTAAPKTRKDRPPGRGHDGTMDSPAAQPEPSEDRDIHHATSPVPTPENAPPAPTISPPLAAIVPAPTSVPPGIANAPAPQHPTAAESRDATHPNLNATNTVEKRKGNGQGDASDPNQPTQPKHPMPATSWRGRSRRGRR